MPSTPRTYCLFLGLSFGLVALSLSARSQAISEQDSLALVALYNELDGPNWKQSSGWLSGPVDGWFGIETAEGRVVKLELTENRLYGALPASIGHLRQLERLFLYGNRLIGPIPPELGNLGRLQVLNLNRNSLRGSIPSAFSQLDSLLYLGLASNRIDGAIPPDLGSMDMLGVLQLTDTSLTGPIPPQLANLDNLIRLYLSDNKLTGPIPPELGSMSQLWSLRLGVNRLTGPVPEELGGLHELRDLIISQNNLTGPLPRSVMGLPLLSTLNFGAFNGVCAPADDEFQTWLFSLGEGSDTGPTCDAATHDEADAPFQFQVRAPFPSPTHGRATLDYELATPAHITVSVIDGLGRLVGRQRVDRHWAGRHRLPLDLAHVSAGVYHVHAVIQPDGEQTSPRVFHHTLSVVR